MDFKIKQIPNIKPLSTDYIGSKRLLENFLVRNIIYNSKLKFNSVIDAFSGSAFVGHLFKRYCKEVHSNDYFDYPYTTAKSLIENNSKFIQSGLFGMGDVNSKLKKIYSVPLKNHKIQSVYGQKFYTEEENDFFELIRQNTELFKEPDRSFILTALCRMVLRRIEHGKFSGTNNLGLREKYGVKLLPLKEHFKKEIERLNSAVFDNGKNNKAYKKNILEWENHPKTDLVYMDPPYCLTHSDYESSYFFVEALVRNWDDWTIPLHNKNLRIKTGRDKHFVGKKNGFKSFERMLNLFSDIPQIVISYNDDAYPTQKQIIDMLGKNGYKDIEIFSKKHQYLQQAQSELTKTRQPKVVNELLIIGVK